MKKKSLLIMLSMVAAASILAGCGNAEVIEAVNGSQVEIVEGIREEESEEPEVSETAEEQEPEEKGTEESEAEEDEISVKVAMADREFFDYINEKRLEAGLDEFVWSDELAESAIEYAEMYADKVDMSDKELAYHYVYFHSREIDYDEWFDYGHDSFLSNEEGYVAGDAAVATYNANGYWFMVFGGNMQEGYSYTDMDVTINTEDTKIASLSEGEAVEEQAVETMAQEQIIVQSEDELWDYLLQLADEGLIGSGYQITENVSSEPTSSREFLNYLNQKRVAANLAEIPWSSEAESIALARAKELASDYSHNGSRSHGENIMKTFSNSYITWYDSWYISDGHRAIMLENNENLTGGACASYFSGDAYYVVFVTLVGTPNNGDINAIGGSNEMHIVSEYVNPETGGSVTTWGDEGVTSLQPGDEGYDEIMDLINSAWGN